MLMWLGPFQGGCALEQCQGSYPSCTQPPALRTIRTWPRQTTSRKAVPGFALRHMPMNLGLPRRHRDHGGHWSGVGKPVREIWCMRAQHSIHEAAACLDADGGGLSGRLTSCIHPAVSRIDGTSASLRCFCSSPVLKGRKAA